eukprot:GHVU01031762.1.p2 GENE.GHVU01031762.1~~GHVU01031762.1.p2  ORF type:complete len:172 (-),score=48.87 GHVU01031762.1:1258-1773(-)
MTNLAATLLDSLDSKIAKTGAVFQEKEDITSYAPAQSYAEKWLSLKGDVDGARRKLQDLKFEVKNKMELLQEVKKLFLNRDWAYIALQEHTKRYDKLKSQGYPDADVEKETAKIRRDQIDYDDATKETSERCNHMLGDKNVFLRNRLKELRDIQAELFAKAANDLNAVELN